MWSISVSEIQRNVSCMYMYLYIYIRIVCGVSWIKWWTMSAPSHFRLLLCITPYWWDLPLNFMARIPKKSLLKSHKKKWKLAFPCHPSSMCSCRISSKSIKALSHRLPFSQALMAALKAMALQKPDPDGSVFYAPIWGFPKMVVPNNHGFFLLKIMILGCFEGTTI